MSLGNAATEDGDADLWVLESPLLNHRASPLVVAADGVIDVSDQTQRTASGYTRLPALL
jgi:hypothetical protein